MRYFLIVSMLLSFTAHAQLQNVVELSQKAEGSEANAKAELLHSASLKTMEKYAPELGFKFEEFKTKLDQKFEEHFDAFKERKLVEKFGKSYKENLSEEEKAKFLQTLESDKHAQYIRFSQSSALLKTHKFETINQDEKQPGLWNAKIAIDLDKVKFERFLRRIVNNETKPFSKVYLISEVTPLQFSWPD